MDVIGWCDGQLLFESSYLMSVGVRKVLKVEWARDTANQTRTYCHDKQRALDQGRQLLTSILASFALP